MKKLILILALFTSSVSLAQVPFITIFSKNGNEEKARKLLLSLHKNYDLKPWLFTKKVKIKTKETPQNKNGVLILNTRLVDRPDAFLSTYIHEQLHAYVEPKEKKVVEEMKNLYPTIPKKGVARTEYSTYLHISVCWLEVNSMKTLVGKDIATHVAQMNDIYPWIYEQVLKNGPAIEEKIKKLNLIYPPSGAKK
jgi:hypothetical protein